VWLAVWSFQLIAALTKLGVAPQGVRIGMRMVRGRGTQLGNLKLPHLPLPTAQPPATRIEDAHATAPVRPFLQ
jgi:hypothetical protein